MALNRPEWVERINREGRMWAAADMLADMVPLDFDGLVAAARRQTGLSDFGEADWVEPLEVLIGSLETEAELNLMGRLITRSELIVWLANRLKITDLVRRHPEIREEVIDRPIFIAGLGRSGTSILQELLHQDPALRTPLFWETYYPVESALSRGSDARAQRLGDEMVTQWIRITPEMQAIHETAGHLPAEDASLVTFGLLTDVIPSFFNIPTYHRYLYRADPDLFYRNHKLALQLLQWRRPGRRWFTKSATWHLVNLETLFRHYPDARIIHTHRDPLRINASVGNLLRTFYFQRSDKPFDAPGFKALLDGSETARLLEGVIDLRQSGRVPENQIVDSLYQDLMDDPVAALAKIYAAFDMAFDDAAARRIGEYLAFKPKHKHGVHRYATLSAEERAQKRPALARYQRHYGVPDEL